MRTLRVMYHSRDAQDDDRAVTGLVSYPVGEAPDRGWPVIAWAHGTTGLAPQCAPSRADRAAPGFGIEGVAVATDYIGMGPPGERHPYLSGPSEAHSVIDAVRAARLLPDAHAGSRWVAVGHSQGGHSALWTNELAQAYAPELELLGTAVVAPAAVFDKTFGPEDQLVPHMVGLMAVYGAEAEYPDEIDADDYVSDEISALAGVIDAGCLDDITAAFITVPLDGAYDQHPLATEPLRTISAQNDPGHVAVASPILLVRGTDDAYVVPDRVQHLFERLCDIGQVADDVVIDGADHGTVVAEAGPRLTAWFHARFDGEPAPDACVGSADRRTAERSEGRLNTPPSAPARTPPARAAGPG
jgi:pimeloyl-ACP methyl ester carboxylesterase